MSLFLRRQQMLRSGLSVLVGICVVCSGAPLLGQAVILPGRQNTTGSALGRGYPNITYYNAYQYIAEGDFYSASQLFENAGRSAVRSPQGRWIDSICYYAMLGESYYQLGQYEQALKSFDDALRLCVRHQGWMRLVDYPNVVIADRNLARLRLTWGPSARAPVAGRFDRNLKLLRGRLDNENVLRQGGVVQLPEFALVNVHEIVRCTSLALRRRIDILGPICRQDELTSSLVTALEGRIGKANHWSQAWVNIQRGLAQAGAERFDEARKSLNAAIVVAGKFDHPLTATALLELGKMELRRGENAAAVPLLFEASMAAAMFEQPLELEESLRLLGIAHVLTGAQEPHPALTAAIPWINRQRNLGRFVQSSCLMTLADSLVHLEKPVEAAEALKKAKQGIRRKAALNDRLKSRVRFLEAQIASQKGKVDLSKTALQDALESQRTTSIGLFRAALVDRRFEEGSFTDRVGAMLYELILADPQASDWQQNPLETFALLTTDRTRSFENWFQAVLAREDTQKAIEIADHMRRREFYSSLPMGGRLLSLRWMLDGPSAILDAETKINRQDLLTRAPKFSEYQAEVEPLRRQLSAMPVAVADEQRAEVTEICKKIYALSNKQENLLHKIALKREHSPLLFPQIAKVETIQERLVKNELLLIFVKSGNDLHAFMLSAEKYANWKVTAPEEIKRTLVKLNKALGNQDSNASISTDQFARMDWRPLAEQLRDQLFLDADKPADRQQFGFWNRFDRLVIVPDDIIWHVPFEILLVPDKDAPDNGARTRIPLIEKTKIRYLPLASLSIPDNRPDLRSRDIPVLVGELYPRSGSVTGDHFGEWQQSLTNLTALPEKLPAPSGIMRIAWDRLVVLDDLDNRKFTGHDWQPATTGKPSSIGKMAQWMKLPWGGPQEVLLPGFHTGAEDAFKKPDDGKSLFLASTALMASGAKTALLSRWRSGGATSFSLLREYLQERTDLSPTQAWQRAVHVVRPSPVDADLEPRVNISRKVETEVTAEHPFFWAGYILFDRSERPKVENPEQADARFGGR